MQSRTVVDAVPRLLDTLKWAGLPYEEGPERPTRFGPYIQSERLNIYHKYAQHLLATGKAYKCFCSKERLESLKNTKGEGYDGHCRMVPRNEGEGPYVIRFKVPPGSTTFYDLVYGRIHTSNRQHADAILIKSDGFPTYHFANIVDDHLMGITTVLRGQEWIPSTPLHILLYEAFEWESPRFAHLPLLINPNGSKLSKRQKDAFVDHYKEAGYLPAALLNFVALLGWTPPVDQSEVMSLDVMIQLFDIQYLNRADSLVNVAKLDWFNRQHLTTSDDQLDNLVSELRLLIPNESSFSDEYLHGCIKLLSSRVTFIREIASSAGYLFKLPEYSNVLQSDQKSLDYLRDVRDSMECLSGPESGDQKSLAVALAQIIQDICQRTGFKSASALRALRFAITGCRMGASIIDTMSLLGKEECIRRICLYLSYSTNKNG